MELTIDIPQKVVERAAALGLPVSTLVSRAIDDIGEDPIPEGFVRLGPIPPRSRAEATASILEMRKSRTLEGLRVKDLIEEGRRL